MTSIKLKPEEGDLIDVPVGKTVIGRGAFLNVRFAEFIYCLIRHVLKSRNWIVTAVLQHMAIVQIVIGVITHCNSIMGVITYCNSCVRDTSSLQLGLYPNDKYGCKSDYFYCAISTILNTCIVLFPLLWPYHKNDRIMSLWWKMGQSYKTAFLCYFNCHMSFWYICPSFHLR